MVLRISWLKVLNYRIEVFKSWIYFSDIFLQFNCNNINAAHIIGGDFQVNMINSTSKKTLLFIATLNFNNSILL